MFTLKRTSLLVVDINNAKMIVSKDVSDGGFLAIYLAFGLILGLVKNVIVSGF